ncbi:MAG: ribbon-helix-helix domain-containing protein [bacterium]
MAKPVKKTVKKMPTGRLGGPRTARRGAAKRTGKRVSPTGLTVPETFIAPIQRDRLPEKVDTDTIERLVAEAEEGIPAEKLRRRGRPSIGDEASSTYSVRLPDDLVTLADERSALDGVSRGETIRRALIEYLTH